RANIFELGGNAELRILQGFHVNMDEEEELTIRFPNGYGATGKAFAFGRPVVFVSDDNGKIPDVKDSKTPEDIQKRLVLAESKVHRELKWVISMPIYHSIKPLSVVCGVLNVDSLDGSDASMNELRNKLKDRWADLASAAELI